MSTLFDELYRYDVETMCKKIFNVSFDSVGKIIYPKPKYKTFLIKKKSGGSRLISEPRFAVKDLQNKLLRFLYGTSAEMKKCVHGFTKSRSIVTNARRHCSPKTRYVLNLDLENFFPSITFFRIRGLFQAGPFNFSYENSTVLAHLCCHQGTLPQGAPTSPILANLVCRTLDKDLMDLAYRNRANYTRYCDDITFSFSVRNAEKLPGGICNFDGSIVNLGEELVTLIKKNGFSVNPGKTRISNYLRRMEVTGLTINKFPNVERDFVDRIRGALHSWQKFGYAAAEARWQEMPYQRQNRVPLTPPLHRVICGRLLYLKMVRSSEDLLYTRLAERYNKLVEIQKLSDADFKGQLLKVSPLVRNAADVSSAIFVVDCYGDHVASGNVVACQGTAFAFGTHGLLTCDHVLRYQKPPQSEGSWDDDGSDPYIDLLSNSVLDLVDAETGVRRRFEILFRDPGRDLALLKFSEEEPASLRHFVSMDVPIDLHQSGRLLGFPNWTPAKKIHNDSPCVITNSYMRSALKRIEIDVLIRQGNSGGPLVDSSYKVAGMAQQGATQDKGNNECLSIFEIEQWIADMSLASLT